MDAHEVKGVAVSPACAGMIPTAHGKWRGFESEPRMRGDDPAQQETVEAQKQ